MSLVSSTASASDIQMDYMKLLITQLQNQNPLEPLSNNEMASQLAQFSSLQQL
ncbi:MAG: flagellar hook capping FlgD N-terminal domain-containing protein, partial [Planctomycetota bacterium]